MKINTFLNRNKLIIQSIFHLLIRNNIRQHVLNYTTPSQTMLELNCGTGLDAMFFVNQGLFVHATDNADGMLNQLQQKVINYKLEGRLTFQKCSFNELEQLEEELKLLSNAEEIKTVLDKVAVELSSSEDPVVARIKQLSNNLQTMQIWVAELPALSDRLKASQIELQDIADELERINNNIHFDAQRIDWVNQRLSDGYKLTKKHGVSTTAELLAIQTELSNKLFAAVAIDEAILAKQVQANDLMHQLKQTAKQITAARNKVIAPFEESVNALLKQVGMPNAQIKVSMQTVALGAYGVEQIELLFDANKSNRFEPIRKVASGGELSRLMLCIKSLVAEYIDLPTMIFDEIDTGISGEAAKQVGLIMQQMAVKRQIICITHQPQIAGKANAHYFVYKENKNEQIKTNIKILNNEERITAIAQMLSGEKPTAAALENAKEMILH